jgi:asparagine synthase (glutamine-hydrolysing)
MCGIVALHEARAVGVEAGIEAANARLAHRGPDDSGTFRDPTSGLMLAMRRLSIIDLAGGHQPMSTPDGRFTIVYNGELFNAPELRKALEEKGERFATDHSDTEVVLRLYAREGESSLQRLNGMYAFAIFDSEKKTLFCARDHAGIKPLYWFQKDGRFAAASELKALLAFPFVPRELDRASLSHYMSLMYVPGEASILKDVRRLPAGHCLRYDLESGKVSVRRWYARSFDPQRGVAREAWRERVRAEVEAAVKRWTLSDVPLACSLSGGLDSSAIVGVLAAAGKAPETFSVGFTGAGEEAWNELPLARKVAEKWGTRHHELVLDPEALLEDLLPMVWALDEPYGGGLPSWLVFKEMSRSVKVGLTGTGGDELFGNYGKWRELEGAWWRLAGGRTGADAFRKRFFERYYYLSDPDKRASVLQDASASTGDALYARFASNEELGIRDRVAALDLETQLPEEFLAMTDRFSMAHSLEARTPFLDRRLMECVWTIPAAERTARGDLKGLLRESIAGLLPPELLAAGKRGFVLPLKPWLRGRLRPVVERLLAPERLARQGLFQPQFHERYVRPHVEGRADHTQVVWAALMFQLWHHLYIDTAATGAPSYSVGDIA